jgi:hypothetical protein
MRANSQTMKRVARSALPMLSCESSRGALMTARLLVWLCFCPTALTLCSWSVESDPRKPLVTAKQVLFRGDWTIADDLWYICREQHEQAHSDDTQLRSSCDGAFRAGPGFARAHCAGRGVERGIVMAPCVPRDRAWCLRLRLRRHGPSILLKKKTNRRSRGRRSRYAQHPRQPPSKSIHVTCSRCSSVLKPPQASFSPTQASLSPLKPCSTSVMCNIVDVAPLNLLKPPS